MVYVVCFRVLERCCLALLLVSAAGSSMASECNDFELRKRNDDCGNWRWIRFEDTKDCFMCTKGNDKELAELVLPCLDPSQSSVKRQLQISYIDGQDKSESKDIDMSPSFITEKGRRNCQDEYSSATALKKSCRIPSSGEQLQRSDFQSGMVEIFDINSTISYRLKALLPKGSILCLTSMEFKQTSTTRDSLSTSNGKKNTELMATECNKEHTQSRFPIWVIALIILIVVTGIFAVVGVFFRQRKHHDHQPDYNVNTETTDGHSNQMKENTRSDNDVILNPTYGQDPSTEKDEEYHSYTEIDVKVPANSDMIYNSAYESQPSNNGMIYNSAYESQPPNNGMIYNSAYESSTSN